MNATAAFRRCATLLLLFGLLTSGAGVAAAQAADPALPERSATTPSRWWFYYGQTPEQVAERVKALDARIIDIEVESPSPPRLSVVLVHNSGVHRKAWWWYYGLTREALTAKLREHGARIVDLEVYQVGGETRFAAVLVPNTGPGALAWWWYYNLSFEDLEARIRDHQARLIDIESYLVGNRRLYAAVMVRNAGAGALAWWLYSNVTPASIAEKLKANRARLVDVEPEGAGRFAAVMVRAGDLAPGRAVELVGEGPRFAVLDRAGVTSARTWWYSGVRPEEIPTIWRRHGGRVIDIEPYLEGGQRRFSILLLDNGFLRAGKAVPALAPFDRRIANLMKKWDVPGAALAVAKGGRLVLARGYGYASLEGNRPVRPDDLFRIASISKPITLSAVRMLREAGKLKFGDKALRYLPSLIPPGSPADPRVNRITIDHLLVHKGGWDIQTLGFDPMFYSNQVAQALGTPRPTSCENVIRYMLARQKLNHPPGATEAYSNFGYCILGRIIETVSGLPYERYMRERILAPAGITRMRMGRTLSRAEGEVSYYHYVLGPPAATVFPSGPGQVPSPYGGFHLEAMDAHGGWISSAVDLVRFAKNAKPAPYSGNWSFNGSLPGTRSRVVRSGGGDLIVAAVFNTRPGDDKTFGDAIAEALDKASQEVTSWPNHDLFGEFK